MFESTSDHLQKGKIVKLNDENCFSGISALRGILSTNKSILFYFYLFIFKFFYDYLLFETRDRLKIKLV